MNPHVESLKARFYDKVPGWKDGTRRFAELIRERLSANMTILDLGCGRGKPGPVNFKGLVRDVVGVEPLKAELESNTRIDRGLIGTAEEIPCADGSFDLIFSDWVLEHIDRPAKMALEVRRVLKPGGWFLFRTGNRRHYVCLTASLTPHWFHRQVANRVRGLPAGSSDPFPTRYRMNTRSRVRKIMHAAGLVEESLLMVEAEPSYLMFAQLPFLLGVAYERVVNSTELLAGFRSSILGCYRKA